MNDLIPRLNELDYVNRYAWFDTSTNNLNYEKLRTSDLIDDKNQLTVLGLNYSTK
tara:strand:+ start:78 stop:242 length:165 start_codon:yes stop_codon:yes gene_type:complete